MSLETEYLELLNSYVSTVARGNAQSAANHYTEDAILLLPNKPALVGRDQIAAHYRETIGDGIEQTVLYDEIQDFGDIICITGTAVAGEVNGKWLEVLRRAEDGSLRIYRLAFNET